MTCCSPLVWSGYTSVTESHPGANAPRRADGQRYDWRDHGGPFVNYRSHSAWPEIKTPAEVRFNVFGMGCNLALYALLSGFAVVIGRNQIARLVLNQRDSRSEAASLS